MNNLKLIILFLLFTLSSKASENEFESTFKLMGEERILFYHRVTLSDHLFDVLVKQNQGEDHLVIKNEKNKLYQKSRGSVSSGFVDIRLYSKEGKPYAASKNEKASSDDGDVEHSALGIGLGMVMGDIEGYFNYRLSDDHEGQGGATGLAADEVERSMMLIGGSYSLGDMTFFASYGVTDLEKTENATKTADVSTTTIELGVGRIHEVSSTSRFFVDVTFRSVKEELEGRDDDDKDTSLPVTVGYEGDATSWLTLRGSVSQNVFLGTEERGGDKRAMNNSTAVNAGATLNFGSLMVDGTIGSGANNDMLSLGDDFMGKVAVHYWF